MDHRKTLLELQKTDNELSAARNRLKRLNSGVHPSSTGLDEQKKRLADLSRLMGEHRSIIRRCEAEAASYLEQEKSLEIKLFQANTPPRELSQLQQKLAEIRAARAKTEEKLLAMLYEAETEQQQVEGLKEKITDHQNRLFNEEAAAQADQTELERMIHDLDLQRGRLISSIDPNLLSLYERLRKACNGLAAVRIEHGCCSGCRVTLSDGLLSQISLRPGQIAHCETCGRILIEEPEHGL